MRALAPLLGLMVVGCSPGMEDVFFEDPTFDSETAAGTLRLDVDPPDTTGAGVLLPQSHVVTPERYVGLDVSLYETLTVSGTLTAEVTHGWSAGAPTTPEPLVATILALAGQDRLGAIAQSGADGSFTVSYPSYPAYPSPTQLVFVPADAELAPMLVLDAPNTNRARWDQEIEPGIPVYGRVTGVIDGAEQSIAGVSLRISRLVNGVRMYSAAFTTDTTGWYVARVDQVGDYTIEVQGGACGADAQLCPSYSMPVLVEGAEGAQVSLELGTVGNDVTVNGSVVDAQGTPLEAARVRFTSTELDGSGGSLVVETYTNRGEGNFFTDLLPGRYDVEVIPQYSADTVAASPMRREGVRIDERVDLGELQLGASKRLAGIIRDASSEGPAPEVTVVATEVGFDQNVYFGRTDEHGQFDFAVPDVPLVLTLTPSNPESGAVTRREIDAPTADVQVDLDPGVPVDGWVTYDGTAIGTASVKVYDAASGDLLGQTFSDESGYFSLRVSLPEPEEEDPVDTGADTGADTGPALKSSDTGDTGDTATEDTGADTAADTASAR